MTAEVVLACLVALGAFGWFIWLIRRQRRTLGPGENQADIGYSGGCLTEAPRFRHLPASGDPRQSQQANGRPPEPAASY